MKNLKKVLSLMLVLVMTLTLCACGADNSVTREEVAQMIEDANEVARAAGYFEGLNDGLNRAENFICDCPNCTNPDTDPTLTTLTATDEPEVTQAKRLPIMFNKWGGWIDQNGEEMESWKAEYFFADNREYARVAIAINRLCHNAKGDFTRMRLDELWEKVNAEPSNPEEYLAYEWILSEMPADYDWCLNDLYELIEEDIDFTQPAASIASRIILGKLLEFRDNGTYESATNSHLMHDCEAEGCNRAATVASESDIYYYNPSNSTKGKDEVDWSSMTDAEIVAYLDEQNINSITQFDLQHPTIYFDQLGRVHGAINPDEEYYYATSSGNVYKLDSRTNIDRIGKSPLFDASLRGTYVGTTNRILK